MSEAPLAPVTAESGQRRVRRRQSRRELIVLAAVEVFREMGLEKATLEAVGERVGLSKASLYYYVRSKEELLGHVVVQVVRAQEEALSQLLQSSVDPEERLRAFCQSHVRIICTDPVGAVSARVALSGIRDDVVRRPLHEYMARLETILREGVDAGVFRDMDLRIAQHSIIATLNAVPLWFSPQGRLSLDQVAAEVTGLLVDGVRARRHG
ncbi:MAG: TetR/AcrR family transcriptional regulator [Chloroflexi bacterium]|nr:TetR/AcrR family transcriptional regulator [Chloroflexota bacterium]